MTTPHLEPGTHFLLPESQQPTQQARQHPANIQTSGWHPRKQKSPDTTSRISRPPHPKGPEPPRFCATPQELEPRRRQDPIPLSTHRGRLEHVHSDRKPLPRGRGPPASTRLGSGPGSPGGSTPPPAAAPHLPAVHVGPRSPLRASAPGAGRGPLPPNGRSGVRLEKGNSAGGEWAPRVAPPVLSSSRPFSPPRRSHSL